MDVNNPTGSTGLVAIDKRGSHALFLDPVSYEELGRLALEEVSFVPLGQFVIRTAFRRDITGILHGSSPYPWNVRRA